MSTEHKRAYTPQTSPEQLGEMVKGSLGNLMESIKSGNSERLTAYLKFSGRFHQYSQRNQQLIYLQAPFATRVASYATWKQEGFQVRKLDESKGERGIRILVPIPPAGFKSERRSQRTDELQKEEKDIKTVGFITTRFKVGSVFDISHLTPESQERIPQMFTKIEGDHETIYQRLIAVAESDNIRVVETLDTEGARGRSAMGLIQIRPDQPSGNKAAVIAHELGHEILHKREERQTLSKQVKECHAEATAFAVMAHFGIEIPYSAEYLQNWGNDAESLRKELGYVSYAASYIIKKVHDLSPGEEQSHDRYEI